MLKLNNVETNYANLHIYDAESGVIKYSTEYPHNLDIEINHVQICSARKLNFTKGDCFEIKATTDHISRMFTNGKDLYIPSTMIDVVKVEEKKRLTTSGETTYVNEFTMKMHCEAFRWNLHCEKVDMPRDMELAEFDPDGVWRDVPMKNKTTYYRTCSNSRTGETGVIKEWMTYDKLDKIKVKSDFITRSEKTPERLMREQIAKIMTDCACSSTNISHYEVEKMLEKLDIRIKDAS